MKREMVVVSLQIMLLGWLFIGDGATAYEGYTFFASGATAYLYDGEGQEVHTWRASGSAQTSAYLLADGSALFPIKNRECTFRHNGSYPSGRFQIISWDGEVTWDYTLCDNTFTPGYDIEPMPNGNVLIPAESSSGAARLIEVKPTGATTGEIVWDYTVPDSLNSNNTYCNSVSYNPELDMILIDLQESVRKLVVVDHSTEGNVVYTYQVGTSGRVHAAAWVTKYFLGTDVEIPDADTAAMRTNNLLVVYNGGDKAVEVDMDSKSSVKEFSYRFSDHEGSVQRLPNGNTLMTGGNSRTITEVDDAGNTVATMTAPASIQRVFRYGFDYPGVSRLTTAAERGRVKPQKSPFALSYSAIRNAVTITADPKAGSLSSYRVFSPDGRMVHAGECIGLVTSFSTARLIPGIYFVDIRHVSGVARKNFVKTK